MESTCYVYSLFLKEVVKIKKRYAILLIIAQIYMFVLPAVVSAVTMWDNPRSTVQQYQLTFLRVRDEYQLRYAIYGLPAGTHAVRANFWTNTGTYYDVVFENPSKIAYLTCNGTYIFEMLDSNGNTIAETRQIETTKINAPACRSYENAGLRNELSLTDQKVDDDVTKLIFDDTVFPNASQYVLYKDGEIALVMNKDSESYNNYFLINPNVEQGIFTVAALHANGNVLGSSDYIIGGQDDSTTGGNDGGNNGGGNDGGSDTDNECATIICQCIAELKTALSGKFDELGSQLSSLNTVATGIKNDFTQQLQDNQQIINELKDVNSELDAINTQLTPSTNPSFDDIQIPNINDSDDLIQVDRQTDNTTYFEDAGSAEEPGLLPDIAEPNFNWSDGETSVSPTDQLVPSDPVEPQEEIDVMEVLTPTLIFEPEEQDFELRWNSEQYP